VAARIVFHRRRIVQGDRISNRSIFAYNISSDDKTIDAENLVLFRKKDILHIQKELAERGHCIYPLEFDPGHGFFDRYIAYPPFNDNRMEPHLKLQTGDFVATSIGLVVKKAS
jgi:hypothetical protein